MKNTDEIFHEMVPRPAFQYYHGEYSLCTLVDAMLGKAHTGFNDSSYDEQTVSTGVCM